MQPLRLRLRTALLLLAGLCWPQWAQALGPVSSEQWFTRETAHFAIHFQADGADAAAAIATIAEDVRSYINTELGWDPGFQHVLIDSKLDITNGLSTPVPYNQIRIYAYPPRSDSELHSYRDWLEMVFLHEYVHAVHLDMAYGPTRYLRYLFGRKPVYTIGWLPARPTALAAGIGIPVVPFISAFPNALNPPWVTEGLAVYYESHATGRGRAFSAYGRTLVEQALANREIGHWSNMSSYGFRRWPRGSTPYQVGGAFLASLPREDLQRWQYLNAWSFAPFLPWIPYSIATKESLNTAWKRFRKSTLQGMLAETANRNNTWSRLDGAAHTGALTTDGTDIFWIRNTGEDVPRIMQLDTATGKTRAITHIDGATWLAAHPKVFVAQVYEYDNAYTLRQQLYVYNRAKGSGQLLPDTRTMVEPALNAQLQVAAVRRRGFDSELWIGQLSENLQDIQWQKMITATTGTDTLHTPAWSAEGTALVYVRHASDRGHDIWHYDLAEDAHRILFASRREEIHPSWDQNRVWFSSSRSGRFELYSVDTTTAAVQQHSHTDTGLRRPIVVQDQVYAERYTAQGYDIVFRENDRKTSQLDPALPVPTGELQYATASSEVAASPARPYRVGTSILPRSWTPLLALELGAAAPVEGLGALVSGVDITGRHSWEAGFMSSLRKFRPLARLQYVLATNKLDYIGELDLAAPTWQDSANNLWDTKLLQAMLATRHVHPRRTRAWTLLTGINTRWYPTGGIVPTNALEASAFGMEVGPLVSFNWNNYSTTYLVPGPHHGFGFSVFGQAHWAHTESGSSGQVLAAGLHLHTAWRLFHHNHLKLEGWLGGSSGLPMRLRLFTLQGTTLQSTSAQAQLYNVSLLSPLPTAQSGPSLLVARAVFTQPIWYIDRGLGYIPVFLRDLHWRSWFEMASVQHTNWSSPKQYGLPPTLGSEILFSAVILDNFPLGLGVGIYKQFGQLSTRPGLSLRLSVGF